MGKAGAQRSPFSVSKYGVRHHLLAIVIYRSDVVTDKDAHEHFLDLYIELKHSGVYPHWMALQDYDYEITYVPTGYDPSDLGGWSMFHYVSFASEVEETKYILANGPFERYDKPWGIIEDRQFSCCPPLPAALQSPAHTSGEN